MRQESNKEEENLDVKERELENYNDEKIKEGQKQRKTV
jgi:hypothetical protein